MQDRFIWDEKYSVGVVEIDGQHKMFFDLTNEIVDFINSQNSDRNSLMDLINKFQAYSFYHLNYEENYFNMYGYEDKAAHKKEHDDYRSVVENFRQSCLLPDSDIRKIATEFSVFSSSWLKQHILLTDSKYSDFFKQNNIGKMLNIGIF